MSWGGAVFSEWEAHRCCQHPPVGILRQARSFSWHHQEIVEFFKWWKLLPLQVFFSLKYFTWKPLYNEDYMLLSLPRCLITDWNKFFWERNAIFFCRYMFYFCNLKKRFYLFILGGEGREKERERNINVCLPLACPTLGTWPTTQACALTRIQTSDPLVHRLALTPLSHTSQSSIS